MSAVQKIISVIRKSVVENVNRVTVAITWTHSEQVTAIPVLENVISVCTIPKVFIASFVNLDFMVTLYSSHVVVRCNTIPNYSNEY